jgi:DNA-binding response OmpR family regulator
MTRSSRSPLVLLVECKTLPDQARGLVEQLEALPADVRVVHAGAGTDKVVVDDRCDLVIVEAGESRLSAAQALKQVRESGRCVPVLLCERPLVSARERAVAAPCDPATDLADDWLAQPCSAAELRLRAAALLGRGAVAATEPPSIELAGIRLQRNSCALHVGGRAPVVLLPREFDLLWHLARRAGQACERRDLMREVWGYDHDGFRHVVASHIDRLRLRLAGAEVDSVRIDTVWGMGYLLTNALSVALPEEQSAGTTLAERVTLSRDFAPFGNRTTGMMKARRGDKPGQRTQDQVPGDH